MSEQSPEQTQPETTDVPVEKIEKTVETEKTTEETETPVDPETSTIGDGSDQVTDS